MITAKGSIPFIVWWNVKVEEFEKKIHRNISNEVIAGILEDAQYGIREAAVEYLYEGHFKIVAFNESTDLEAIGAQLNEIIEEYELEDY
ncbi:inhibitor of MrcBC restriction [Edwardsiella phage PEi20]|uniref:Uncharacterized protein n=2 Tax=Kanagawavirus pei20 TaxID=2844109 RepID=A0A0B6VT57_9CAUD|nr:inhibitor of MrcBC restriction [Edwardsiella phage PEi20]BAQ22930.1 hypothetical protein [Edwardsiella phage PEi20]BAQ23230.1 hypothetical protein [Edwardsiella phage PEi26]